MANLTRRSGNDATPRAVPLPVSTWGSDPWKLLAGIICVLVVAYILPLYELARFSFGKDLFSHVLLVPAITVYLIRTSRDCWPALHSGDRMFLIPCVAAVTVLIAYFVRLKTGWNAPTQDRIAWLTLSFVCLVWSACLYSLGRGFCQKMMFPLVFMIFMVPFPQAVEHWLEAALQHGSADVSHWFIQLSGTPILRDGTLFTLPNISLQVAPECSGIRSSLVLFMTGLLAGYFFLRRTSSKLFFGALVLGLGIVRNAFRIFVLAMLCVHVDPNFIHSALHRRGGPVFFALSLIPFFLILWLLRRWERRGLRPNAETLKS